jgi:hypothetical protein
VALVVPLRVWLFYAIHRHYRHEKRQIGALARPRPSRRPHAVLVPVGAINRAVAETLEYAASASDDVTAVHVAVDRREGQRFAERWSKWAPDVKLKVVESPYRDVVGMILEVVGEFQQSAADHQVMVMVPDVIPAHWYEEVLHNQTSLAIAAALRQREGVALSLVPVHLS